MRMCESGRKQCRSKRENSVMEGVRGLGGWWCYSCSWVSAAERCTISAATAAKVKLHSNPGFKTSAESLKQITDIFPFSPPAPLLNNGQHVPPNFCNVQRKCPSAIIIHQHLFQLSIQKAAEMSREKKKVGSRILVPTLF